VGKKGTKKAARVKEAGCSFTLTAGMFDKKGAVI
jgi:hypothetical protein